MPTQWTVHRRTPPAGPRAQYELGQTTDRRCSGCSGMRCRAIQVDPAPLWTAVRRRSLPSSTDSTCSRWGMSVPAARVAVVFLGAPAHTQRAAGGRPRKSSAGRCAHVGPVVAAREHVRCATTAPRAHGSSRDRICFADGFTRENMCFEKYVAENIAPKYSRQIFPKYDQPIFASKYTLRKLVLQSTSLTYHPPNSPATSSM